MKRIQIHLVRALLLGIGFIACSALVLFTSSFTSMTELRTGLVNDGKGLLCKHNRHASQLLHQPYFPASQWYVDLASGRARKLSKNDIVAKSLLRSHLSWQSMFDDESTIVRQNESAFDNFHDFGMRPVISGGKIEELVLNRTEYSLRASGGGENFRIEWFNAPTSSATRAPVELLMHVFISEAANRMISYSSRGSANAPNIQLRDLTDPDPMIAQWRRFQNSPPMCDAETIYTITENQSGIERRSLRTGELLETISMNLPAGSFSTVIHIDIDNHWLVGHGTINNVTGAFAMDFRTGMEVAFVPDAISIDYSPVSQCILLLPRGMQSQTRSVLSIGSRKLVPLEGVKEDDLRTLHLSNIEPRVVAVMRDGSIQIHSLPNGELISKIVSMQHHKDLLTVLSVASVAAWLVCLVVSGRRENSYESVDITIALGVIWGCLVVLHQSTCISMGLGAGLNSFSLGATCATLISLTEWSLFHSTHSRTRLFRLVLTIGLLLGILAIEIRDQLAFGYRNFREAVFGGIAFVVICSGVGLVNYYWRQRRISQNAKAAKKRTQWSLAMMIYCMALVAVACSILNFAAAQDKVRWWWLGRFLLTHVLVIVSGMVCFPTWRSASFQSNQLAHSFCLRGLLVFTGTFVLVGVSAAFTALLGDRFLSLNCSLYDSNFCFWYTIGFISIFSILRYRTSHRFVSWRNVGSC